MNHLKIAMTGFKDLLGKRGIYAMPRSYPVWDAVLSLVASHAAMLSIDEKLNNTELGSQLDSRNLICFWSKFVEETVPVYCVTEELLELFKMTDVSNIYTLIPEDWEPPLKDVLFVYPNGFKQAGKDVVFSTCSFGKIKKAPGDLLTLASVLSITSYSPNTDVSQEMLNVRESSANNVASILNSDESNSFLFPIVLQCFLALSYCPELFDSCDGETKTLGFGKKSPEGKANSRNLRPRWIGKNIKNVRSVPNERSYSTHSTPEKHWRRGHWRNQPCGKKGADRRVLWIRPVLVGC